jgi:hypothetical protein
VSREFNEIVHGGIERRCTIASDDPAPRLSLPLPAACSSIRIMDRPLRNEPIGQQSDTSVEMKPAVRTAAQSIRAASVGAVAIGALAFGAAAIGALAIGRVVIGALALKRGHVRSLAVEDLRVGRLHIRELAIEREIAGRPRA